MSHRNPLCTNREARLLALIGAGSLLFGCDSESSAPAPGERGRQLYRAECSGCHGEHGLGDGPGAQATDPKPRNFVHERFKFRSTASFQPPLRADIVETIARGMPGSAMPAFDFLEEEERDLIADHVMVLAGLDRNPEREVLVIPDETPATADSIARGHEVYMKLGCQQCHGEDGHGDGPSAATLKDAQGRKIEARDFRLGLFRRGRTGEEIYRTLEAGIDGTPMPSYSGNYTNAEAWNLARYILSLPVSPAPPPANPIAHGRQIVEQRQCFACHVIEGRGSSVGPSLDVSARKLKFAWIRRFLADPRAFGKIYPSTPYRMPDLGLEADEIEAVLAFLGMIAERTYPETSVPLPEIDPEVASGGKLFYVTNCAECHNLGSAIPTPLAMQLGPDLINVSERLRFEWIPEWFANPLADYPGTGMVHTDLDDEEVEGIRAFLWKTSAEALSQ